MKEELIEAIEEGDTKTVSECLKQNPNIIYDGDVLLNTLYPKKYNDTRENDIIKIMIDQIKKDDKINTDFWLVSEDFGFNYEYTNLLCISSRTGNAYAVKLLIDNGADINKPCKTKLNALMEACDYGRNKIVDILLENGASVDIKNEEGKTALMYASEHHHPEIVKTLLKNRPNIHIQNNNEDTALVHACIYGDPEIINILLGEDFTAEDVSQSFRTACLHEDNYYNTNDYYDAKRSDAIKLLINDPRSLDAIKDTNLEDLINKTPNNSIKSVLLNLRENINKSDLLLEEYKNNTELINQQTKRLKLKFQEKDEFEEKSDFKDKVQAYLDLPEYLKKYKCEKHGIDKTNLYSQIMRYNIEFNRGLDTYEEFSPFKKIKKPSKNPKIQKLKNAQNISSLWNNLKTDETKNDSYIHSIQNLPKNTHKSNESKSK